MTAQLPAYGTRAWYQYIGRKGGRKRAQMPDFTDHQRHAGRCSAQANDMAALGHRGAMATIRKHGYIRFFRLAREYRLQNPSTHEQQVAAILADLNYQFEREAMVLGDDIPLAVDFYIPDANDSIIEVNGRIHYDPLFDHPNRPHARRQLDQLRLIRLERAGFRILEIDHRALANPALVANKIAGFLVCAPERRF